MYKISICSGVLFLQEFQVLRWKRNKNSYTSDNSWTTNPAVGPVFCLLGAAEYGKLFRMSPFNNCQVYIFCTFCYHKFTRKNTKHYDALSYLTSSPEDIPKKVLQKIMFLKLDGPLQGKNSR